MIKILYIEDNEFDSKYLAAMFVSKDDFAPLDVENTLEKGLDRMEKENYQCILLDLSLPDSSGLDTINAVKNCQPQLPIVVFTGLNDQNIALNAINSGVQDYLIKGEITEKLLKKSVYYAIERNKYERELKLAQKNLAKAEKLSKMGNWEYTVRDKKFIISAGLNRILELDSASEILTFEDYLVFVLAVDRPKVKKKLSKTIEDLVPKSYAERIKTKRGNIKHLYTRIDCQLTESGELVSIFGATIDVSESKKSEIQLKESEDKLLQAQELAKIGSWEYNFLSDEFKGSAEAYRIFDLENQINYNALNVINEMTWGADAVRIFNTVKEHVESKEPFTIEFKIGTRKGTQKRIKATAKIFDNDQESGKLMRGTVQDVSLLREAAEVKEKFTKKLESEVEERTSELMSIKAKLETSLEKEKELSELKSRFVSTASHQFRTPLTVIQSSMGLLDMQIEDAPDKLKQTIIKSSNRVRSEVDRMTNIMNDVLILGKIEASQLQTKNKKLDPEIVIQNVIDSYNDIQEDKRQIDLIKIGTERAISIDPNLLEHVLSNLVSNAFKYSVGKPPPQVIIQYKSSSLEIHVVDFGIGIPAKELKSVFEPFYRASNVKTVTGTGLGTTIIKEYIDLMDGEIAVESEENNETVFKIKFKR